MNIIEIKRIVIMREEFKTKVSGSHKTGINEANLAYTKSNQTKPDKNTD